MKYIIMHGDLSVASVTDKGKCHIEKPQFMPWNLWLEEEDDLDTRVSNITNFNYWCATRVLTLDRKYAKEILNSIGAKQAVTDRDRAQIALSYHCLTLTDIYWVRADSDQTTYSRINLYDNHLSNAFVDLSLRGKQMTVENSYLIADDMSTSGVFPKAWIRRPDGFYLYKDGEESAVENEIMASRICRCFDCPQVLYEEKVFEGKKTSVSKLLTSQKYSIATREAFEIYAQNHDIDAMRFITDLDEKGFHMMNILDYLVGNTDRHWGNWGFLIDNRTGKPLRLHDLMDFNQSFHAYDTVEGAGCQTFLSDSAQKKSQLDAAIEGVKRVGLNMLREPSEHIFAGHDALARMFRRRLEILREKIVSK